MRTLQEERTRAFMRERRAQASKAPTGGNSDHDRLSDSSLDGAVDITEGYVRFLISLLVNYRSSLSIAYTDDTTTTTTVHIAAAGTTYVDDTQESTDAASHSSPSGSSMTAGDFDSPLDAPVLSPSYTAVQTNFWSSSLQPYPTPGVSSEAQFSNWGFGTQNHIPLFGHGMSPPTPSDHHHSLSPTGLEGGNIFPFAGQQF